MLGRAYFYTRDHLGSIRELTTSTGTIAARYDYDPYGVTTLVQGTNLADFQYAGMYVHQPSGFYLSATRAYSPNLGRWITRDPIGESGGLNVYAYCGNDPVDAVDPSGNSYILLGVGAAAALTALAAVYIYETYYSNEGMSMSQISALNSKLGPTFKQNPYAPDPGGTGFGTSSCHSFTTAFSGLVTGHGSTSPSSNYGKLGPGGTGAGGTKAMVNALGLNLAQAGNSADLSQGDINGALNNGDVIVIGAYENADGSYGMTPDGQPDHSIAIVGRNNGSYQAYDPYQGQIVNVAPNVISRGAGTYEIYSK